ncbi:hypothetical protein JTB14_000706 [Gonioctena quinquepunctata]|nr:hypothetical protein JTB14_000706 [Gonioctena quinquepunctata]
MYIQGISGIITGFFISTLSKDHSAANSIVFGVFNSQMIICGTFWPIESMHEYIRVLARTLPLTVPIECLRSIVKKGWGLSNPQIQGGIGIMILWILIPAILSIYVMKVKR